MKTFLHISLLLLLLSGLPACQDELFVTVGPPLDGQFMEARLDGQWVRLEHTMGGLHGNVYYFEEYPDLEHPLDQLNLVRKSGNGRTAMHMYVLQGRLLETAYPVEFDADEIIGFCRHAELQVYENAGTTKEKRSTGLVDLIIDTWDAEGFMEGTFNGIVNGEGRAIEVREGRFRIKVIAQLHH